MPLPLSALSGSVRAVNHHDENSSDHGEPVLAKVAAGKVAAAAGIRLGPGAALALGAAGPLYEALAVKEAAGVPARPLRLPPEQLRFGLGGQRGESKQVGYFDPRQ
jgi:hypothetical protein